MRQGHPLLARTNLARRFGGPEGDCPAVATIVAPAGYGKSVLLETLASQNDCGPNVVLSLGECEHHTGLFIDLLAKRLKQSAPGADVRPLLAFKQSVPPEEYPLRFPYALARVLEGVGSESLRVLFDDVQHLRPGEPLTELIGQMIASEASPKVRWVLASRQPPPFDLARFRQTGNMVELTSRELEFTAAEVRALLEQRFGHEVPAPVAESIWDKTRGWAGVIGLLLVLTRTMGLEELEALIDREGSAGEGASSIEDLVVDKLTAGQSQKLRYFTRVISVLSDVRPELATALFSAQELGHRARGRADARRSFIQLPAGEIPSYLERLREAQLLEPSEEGALTFNPIVGRTLSRALKAEDSAVYREAHRRAAAWFIDRGEVNATALDHLVEAGEFEQLLAVLEAEAPRFFDAGYHRHLSQWLLALEGHYATLPFWANYFLGRVYAMLGDWDRARDYLDRCQKGLPQRRDEGDLWRWQPRVCLGFAGMYWRRGMHSDASTYCRRGLDFLRQMRRRGSGDEAQRQEMVELQLRLLNLLGTLKLEAGSYDKAWGVFEEARTLAAEEQLETELAKALKNLGLLSTHKGDAAAAAGFYEQALEHIDRDTDVELYATVAEHLGASHIIVGRYADARRLLEEALAIRMTTGYPTSIARTLTTLGRCEAAGGRNEPADAAFRRAAHMLDNVGNLKTRAKTLNAYAAFLASCGRVHEAQTMHDRAEALIGGLLRAEAPLAAMHRESAMEIAMAKGRLEDALSHLTVAVERHQKLGATYNVARLYWRAAEVHHRLFIEERRTTPESVISYLELASTEANRHGYVFGPDASSRELALVGRALGHPETQEYCGRVLERVDGFVPGEEDEIELPEPAATRYDRFQQRLEREDEYTILSREGRIGAGEQQLEELVEDKGDATLVVMMHTQEMVNFGDTVSLSQKRVILPLLVHFLRYHDTVFTMAELAQNVWESSDLTESMKTKVKVAISRLRSLLGKSRDYILTSRRPDGDGGSVVTYGLAPDLEFYLVESAEGA